MNPAEEHRPKQQPLLVPAGVQRTRKEPTLPQPPTSKEETRLAGWNAVAAAFQNRPEAILRLYFDEPTSRRCGAWCSELAARRRVYRQVPREELERIAGTVHHGGIVAVVPATTLPPLDPHDLPRWSAEGRPLVILDRVANPHNVGLLARTAAFLGYPRLLLGDESPAILPDVVWRLAEGGLEWVSCVRASHLVPLLPALRANFLLLGTTSEPRAGELGGIDWSRVHKPPALVFGNEERGLSPGVRQACEMLITIRGSGRVESLNVAAAAAILLHELRALRDQA